MLTKVPIRNTVTCHLSPGDTKAVLQRLGQNIGQQVQCSGVTQRPLCVTHLYLDCLAPPPARVSVEAQLVTSCHQRPQTSGLEYSEDEALIKTEDAVRKPEAQMVNMARRVEAGNITEILLSAQGTILSLI